MASRHLSLRIDEATFEKLERESRRTGRTRSEIAKTLLEEGLRMEAHPGIVFRPGPTGRRAALADGPDVWVIARVLRDAPKYGETDPEVIAELANVNVFQLQRVARYYAEYRDEIDAWIHRVDDEAERAEAAWLRERDLLAG